MAQKSRHTKSKAESMGVNSPLAKMLYCADCGERLYLYRARHINSTSESFRCTTYLHYNRCTSHSIKRVDIEKLVLDKIKRLCDENPTELKKTLMGKIESTSSARDVETEIIESRTTIIKIDEIIANLYEDKLNGVIDNERYLQMAKKYEDESKTLKAKIDGLKNKISDRDRKVEDVDKFMEILERYKDIKELTVDMARDLIDKIIVSEKVKIGDNKYTQKVKILFNYVGEVHLLKVDNEEIDSKDNVA